MKGKSRKIPSSESKNRKRATGKCLLILIGAFIGATSTLQIISIYDQQTKFADINISTSSTSTNTETNTVQWEDWPATAYKEVGHPLVTKGDSFYDHARDLFYAKNDKGQTLLDEFLEVYKNRPDKVNMCGIRINHAMALYLAVKTIQPTLVVESGVNAGVSTYFIRAASPTTRIFAIDPLAEPICGQGVRWIDDGPESKDLTINYTGDNFVDLMDLDWKEMIKKGDVDPDKTIVFIDDHLNTLKRIAGVMKHGIRHVLVEDNYKIYEGATPNDKRSTPKQMLSGKHWAKEGQWLYQNILAYAEFPPIVPPIVSSARVGVTRKKAGGFMHALDHNKDINPPILRPDLNEEDKKEYERIATFLGYDPLLKDADSYMQFMNYNQFSYLELVPMAPMLVEDEEKASIAVPLDSSNSTKL